MNRTERLKRMQLWLFLMMSLVAILFFGIAVMSFMAGDVAFGAMQTVLCIWFALQLKDMYEELDISISAKIKDMFYEEKSRVADTSNDDKSPEPEQCRGCGDEIPVGSEQWSKLVLNDPRRNVSDFDVYFCKDCTSTMAAVADNMDALPKTRDYR